ncbi:asparagine synthetase B family protein [Nitrogeniibacter mangrovi]|uniref:asparagine synthetase B family protein n=1 Tax=Nitrogeniibacter mangrovi TaxID=2016596 RepID=UPI001E528B29|nr:asparagine synthase-related protein [Nitrogeniibacter mangrovi]
MAESDGLVCIARGRPEFPADSTRDALHTPADHWLALFRAHGAQAPERVHGRFGVAFIDTRERSVFLAADRFGTAPWCFAVRHDRLIVGDRADLVADTDSALSPDAVYAYLFHHMIPSPLTIFADVTRLEGGHRLEWQGDTPRVDAWWRPVFTEPRQMDFGEAKARFMDIIEAAVRKATDRGHVGAFLSGGTDSSTVAGMLTKVLGRPAETYSMGFDASGYDEMEYARIASKHFGTNHHEYYVTPQDLLEAIPRVARHYDQPFGNSSAAPAWLCASLARRDGIDTLLAGDGGDELFGGNTRYAKQRVFGVYDRVPAALRNALLEPALSLPISKRLPIVKKAASYVDQAKVPLPHRIHQYNLLVRLGADQVFAPDFLAQIDQNAPARAHEAVWQRINADSDLNRLLAFDWKYTLEDNDLPKILGTTELAGLGVEFPLLDDALLDFSLSLPLDYKLRGFKLRWFFKEALRDFLPDAIITKKKHGFGLPFGVWACEHKGLHDLSHDTLNALKGRGIVNPRFIDRLLGELLPEHPGYYGELVWILTMMELWLSQTR